MIWSIWIFFAHLTFGIPTFLRRIQQFWSKFFLKSMKNSSTLHNKHGYPHAKMASADSKTHSLTMIWSIWIFFAHLSLGIPTFLRRIHQFWSKFFLKTLKNSSTLHNKHGYPNAKMASADSKTHSLTMIWSILIFFAHLTLGIPTFLHRTHQFRSVHLEIYEEFINFT